VPVTTVDAAGDTVYGQPIPFIWGPYNGTVIFGCGDPNQPGYLYWSDGTKPGSWAAINNVEVSQPSDPLQNGCIWNSQPWAFTKERLYAIYPAPIGSNSFVALDSMAGKGLAARWAIAASPDTPAIFFVGKDAVYATQGGPAQSLTENDLWPLFHGETVEGNAPIDFTQETRIRLVYADQYLYFTFQDTLGAIQTWQFHTTKNRWSGPLEYPFGPGVIYNQPGSTSVLLLGGSDGVTYEQSYTAVDDAGAAIACQMRTGSGDDRDPEASKEYVSVTLDMDCAAASIVPTALFDDEQTLVALAAQTGVGRKQFNLSLSDRYSRSFGLDLSWTAAAAVILYGFELMWRPDEIPVVHVQTPANSFGMPGYGHLYDGYLGIRSDDDVTLTIETTDGIAPAAIVVPSTGGVRKKVYLQFSPNKARMIRVKVDSATSRFRIYREDSYVNLLPWGGGAPQEVRPFQA
jgi:hypothetical protein